MGTREQFFADLQKIGRLACAHKRQVEGTVDRRPFLVEIILVADAQLKSFHAMKGPDDGRLPGIVTA